MTDKIFPVIAPLFGDPSLPHCPLLQNKGARTAPVRVNYCTPVWSPHYRYLGLIDMVERIQRHFMKRVSGLRHLSYSVCKCLAFSQCNAVG